LKPQTLSGGIKLIRHYNRMLSISAALLCFAGLTSRADASLITAICNDLGCTGGDDFIVQDNVSPDTIPGLGSSNFSVSAFGYLLAVNTAQSKSTIGSATLPQLDLTFSATTNDSNTDSIFIYASDTDFLNPHAFVLSFGGTNSGGSGTVTGRAWGGTSNTALQFSAANLLATTGAQTGNTFSSTAAGSFSPTVNPYSLTIGVAVVRTTPGTTTGDLNFATSAVPEPGSIALFSLGFIGLGIGTFRRKSRTV
jgi:hypothetical protein